MNKKEIIEKLDMLLGQSFKLKFEFDKGNIKEDKYWKQVDELDKKIKTLEKKLKDGE